MSFLDSLDDRIGQLVHPDARPVPSDLASHRAFMATRLALSTLALVAAPLCLMAGSSPAWGAAALAWLSLPLAAVAVVSRSGDLRLGEALSLATWIGLAVSVPLGSNAPVALGLFLMIPVEIAVSTALPRVAVAAAVPGATAAMAFGLWRLAVAPGHLPPLAAGGLVAAFLYACANAISGRALARRRAADEHRVRARLAGLAGSLDALVLRLDRKGSACEVASTSERLFGLAAHDLAGRGFFERLQVADRPAYLKALLDVAQAGESRTVTLRLRSGRSSRPGDAGQAEPVFLPVDLTLRPGTDAAAGGGEILALVRDVSERIDAERRAAEARADSDRALAGRDLFLANVTHELRTPLNAIIGFAEMLASETLAPTDEAKRREYAGIVHASGQHLLSVVNGILDATKLEAGRFQLAPEPFDMTRLVEQCCDMVGLKAEQAGVRLTHAVAPALGPLVGDPRACRQILLNLLSNGLKFTPRGGEVAVSARPDGNAVLLTVSDTGIGIAARDLPRLGDPFFQARATYDRAADGTGLGLSVVRGLVGLHGGTIAIESAPGQGTRVSVRLPKEGRRPTAGTVTKIETNPRYFSSVRHGATPGGSRMQRLA